MASVPSSAKARQPYRRAVAGVARRVLKAGALRVVGFVVARPGLDGFLRRQIYRFPGLAGRVRAAIARSRRSTWQTLPVVLTDEADLTDSAREVLHDLRRAIEHGGKP
jgi:hypothetical protein